MKQNIFRKLMLIAVLLTGSHAFAHDFEKDGIYYNILSETNRTVAVTFKGDSYTNSEAYSGYVEIPSKILYNSKKYTVTHIGDHAFYRCSDLRSITIPNSVTTIREYAFYNCTSLLSLTIPNSVTSILRFAFNGCGKLTTIIIPNSVKNIEYGSFQECNNLNSIIVENGNNVYDSRNNCNAIIATQTNALIQGINNTIIPYSVTTINDHAFAECKKLTSIIIPDSVTDIGKYAFVLCENLTSITISKSIIEIGEGAFNSCNKLTDIYCKATNPPIFSSTFPDKVLLYATLYVPKGSKSAYESVDPWRNFWNIKEKEFTGVESTLADDVNVSIENGNILISGADNAYVKVYNVNGQCVYSGTATTIPVTAKGLYIVKVNGKSFKVML